MRREGAECMSLAKRSNVREDREHFIEKFLFLINYVPISEEIVYCIIQ